MQYTLNFNKSTLSFKGLENNKLSLDYNADYAEDGKLSLLWVDAANEPQSLADSTVLFELVFDKKGSLVDEDIDLTSDITPAYAVNANYGEVGIEKEKGNISDATDIVSAESWNVIPNPTKDGLVKVTLSLAKAKKIQFELTTSDGRVTLQQLYNAPKGNSSLLLNLQNKGNLSMGTYYLHAVGIDGKQTKILSVIK
jgi:hypothetical protein